MNYKSEDEYRDASLGWFDNGYLDEAIAASSEGIGKYPDFSDLYQLRCTFYDAAKEYDKAINDAEKFIELEPNGPSMYRYLGYLLQQVGRLREAEKQLSIAIERSQNDLLAHLHRAEVRLKLGEIPSATSDLRHYYQSYGRDNVDELIQKHISANRDTN